MSKANKDTLAACPTKSGTEWASNLQGEQQIAVSQPEPLTARGFNGLRDGVFESGIGALASSLPIFRSTPDSKSQWICMIPSRFLPLAPLRGEGIGG